METFKRLESEVRSYCRTWPTVFKRAVGYHLYDEADKEYIDFFGGAGALSYGHNNPRLKQRLMEYLSSDGVVHGLDMATTAKRQFMETFEEVILKPRGLGYKLQFPGPTGTNAVESALKLARKVTGRQKVVGFTNAFHGMTLGSLAVNGNSTKRKGGGVTLGLATSMPYDGYFGDQVDTMDYFEAFLKDGGSGLDLPAAVIVETVQGEGGINVARFPWLQRLAGICREHGIILIVDDVQVGCGRTGPFFSFEGSEIEPDIICLSKAVGGYGLPMALNLLKPELDIWEPGEHNGTFRGNNAAFVTATEALNCYWRTDELTKAVREKSVLMYRSLLEMTASYPDAGLEPKGLGLIQGLKCPIEGFAEEVVAEAFQRGLIVETSGPDSEVVKLLPPLIIDEG
ncbi:MAG: diaminobutyrate--2-oxoglutarate transaminase, partial [Dehalococcoidia bacterium]